MSSLVGMPGWTHTRVSCGCAEYLSASYLYPWVFSQVLTASTHQHSQSWTALAFALSLWLSFTMSIPLRVKNSAFWGMEKFVLLITSNLAWSSLGTWYNDNALVHTIWGTPQRFLCWEVYRSMRGWCGTLRASHGCVWRVQGCPTGYPYGSVKIFPRPKLHIRMQIKMPQNLAIY